MVMIPVDVGVQVRNQTEAGSHPVRAVGEISAELREFQQGQAFRARIQDVLPENTYKAIVAGRLMTLSLPEGAKAGDTLDLVVVGHARQTIVAQRGQAGSDPGLAPFENTSLSRAGQLIASLFGAEGDALPPANLSRDGPILARAPANSAEIARELPSGLSRAVTGSGMFYEAHQAEWALGQRSLASLLAEPQGRFSDPALLFLVASGGDEATFFALADAAEATPSPKDSQPAGAGRALPDAGVFDADMPAVVRHPVIPDELRPLVQQQLEAGASHRLVWQGEIWPNQVMDWEIVRDQSHAADTPEPQDVWQTRLRLSLPRLGEVDLRLQLGGDVANVMMATAAATSGAVLEAALPALQDSFAAAGLRLAGAQVRRDEPL